MRVDVGKNGWVFSTSHRSERIDDIIEFQLDEYAERMLRVQRDLTQRKIDNRTAQRESDIAKRKAREAILDALRKQ